MAIQAVTFATIRGCRVFHQRQMSANPTEQGQRFGAINLDEYLDQACGVTSLVIRRSAY